MKRMGMMIAGGAALLAPALVGCQNGKTVNAADRTGKAAHSAANRRESATQKAGANSKNALQETAKNVTAAVVVTPKVSSALKSDKTVSAPGNVINVDSRDNVVHLKGKVQTNAIKKRAGELTRKVLTENHSTDRLSNELMVVHH